MIRSSGTVALLVASAALSTPSLTVGWTADGHAMMTAQALDALDEAMPRLSEEAVSMMIRASQQPDLLRPRELEELRDVEAARHFIGLELLGDEELPPSSADFMRLIGRLSADSASAIPPDWQFQSIGTLPYAVVEYTQRLAALLAQLRRRPDDRQLTAMAMYIGGAMAHYAQDLCQPLHTTIHHDGRVDARGVSSQTGIHLLVDRLPGRLSTLLLTVSVETSRDLDPLFPSVIEALRESHGLVDGVYRLESEVRAVEDVHEASPAVRSFTRDRFERSVKLTADLIHTAWRLSQSIDVPGWALPDAAADGR